MVSFLVAGLATAAATLVYGFPLGVALCLLVGAAATSALDAVGNIPFMRSVRAFERPQMTTVFRTYIDFSDLLPAGLFALLLTFYDRSEEHTSELQSLMRISYAVFCLKKKKTKK